MKTTREKDIKKKQSIKVHSRLMAALHQLLADDLTTSNPDQVNSGMCN